MAGAVWIVKATENFLDKTFGQWLHLLFLKILSQT